MSRGKTKLVLCGNEIQSYCKFNLGGDKTISYFIVFLQCDKLEMVNGISCIKYIQ